MIPFSLVYSHDMTESAGIRRAERFAAIDVGSNSVKLSIAVRGTSRRPAVIETARIVSQLGQKQASSGELNAESIERTAQAIAEMVEESRAQEVGDIRAIATAAAREAGNGEMLRARVRALCGLELEIISGEREAELAFHAVSSHHIIDNHRSLVFDTGGGSTELVIADGDRILESRSLPLGALRLADKFDALGRVSDKTQTAIRSHVRKIIGKSGLDIGDARIAVGTGGTCTALALLDIGPLPIPRSGKPPAILRENHTMSRDTIDELVRWLGKMEVPDRKNSTGLKTRRAEIVVAGACIVAELMAIFDMEWVAMLDVGLRDGLLMEMMRPIDES